MKNDGQGKWIGTESASMLPPLAPWRGGFFDFSVLDIAELNVLNTILSSCDLNLGQSIVFGPIVTWVALFSSLCFQLMGHHLLYLFLINLTNITYHYEPSSFNHHNHFLYIQTTIIYMRERERAVEIADLRWNYWFVQWSLYGKLHGYICWIMILKQRMKRWDKTE